MKERWVYDPSDGAWKFGTPNNGGGVYVDEEVANDYDPPWTGNIIVPGGETIIGIGYYHTKEEAQEAVEREYKQAVRRLDL